MYWGNVIKNSASALCCNCSIYSLNVLLTQLAIFICYETFVSHTVKHIKVSCKWRSLKVMLWYWSGLFLFVIFTRHFYNEQTKQRWIINKEDDYTEWNVSSIHWCIRILMLMLFFVEMFKSWLQNILLMKILYFNFKKI